MKKNKKGFTLIELVAVLVIMAVIALIATPLILTLVNNAKASANKRSVDAYGKAVELAAMTYLMDNGEYPSDLGSLQVEYTGSEVTCGVMTLNNDGSLYLSECSVGGAEVKDKNTEDGWYHYGKLTSITYSAYNVGDQITYNGIDFYVISPSDETNDLVTLLKAEPLTVDEVNTYGAGHVNNYTEDSVGTAYDDNGYGIMAYYSSPTCRWDLDSDDYQKEGCTTDYESSEIKYVVDAWANDKLTKADLKADATGYGARLITIDELTSYLGYDDDHINIDDESAGSDPSSNGETPSWVYNENYKYWSMGPMQGSSDRMWFVASDGIVESGGIAHYEGGAVRPVITLLKLAIK